jgi:hypothetical protein
MIGIHFVQLPDFGFVGIMPNGTIRTVRFSAGFGFGSLG